MYKYEILLHGFGLAKQDLNFWNSNGDFRICSYVGYSNSIDEVLAGELEFSVLFTSTKKKKTPGLRGYGKQRFHWWKWGDYNSVQCSVCQISSRDRKNSIGRLAVMLLKMPDVDHKVSVYSWLQGQWHPVGFLTRKITPPMHRGAAWKTQTWRASLLVWAE